MGRHVCFFSFIFLSMILQSFECNSLETKSLLTSHPIFNYSELKIHDTDLLKSDNGTMHNNLKNESSSTFDTKTLTSKEAESSTVEPSARNVTKPVQKILEQSIQYVKNDTDAEENVQISIVLEGSIQNSVLEPWNRIRRDDDEESPEPSSSHEFSQDNASDSDKGPVTDDSSENSDGGTVEEEEAEDSSNKNSSEASSSQLDPVETGSMDVNDREERNARFSEEALEESDGRNGLYSSWYREPSFGNRYWSSDEREPLHNFIKVPIFPGK